ncbi:cartilage intermediate layer protein 2 isoform X1 [Oryzias melastigma]|uniref:cartilage intermediate layer protein 2 isoform X1 n=1 Tax=Oryzias melastigma TaxID=30732 RepID=UPI000CF7F3FA|nr:cartilage intermediate layer protein 2 isoform X1 [Oryzias melastigma]XP_024146694.1 cartilage intermediate layer protein 2 isoform X1 [Oryzias melastigma]
MRTQTARIVTELFGGSTDEHPGQPCNICVFCRPGKKTLWRPCTSTTMIKLVCIAMVAGLVFDLVEPMEKNQMNSLSPRFSKRPPRPAGREPELEVYSSVPIQCWTEWFNRDNPSRGGDRETLSRLRRLYPGKICLNPAGIEATTLSGTPADKTEDKIFKSDTTTGFICRNRDQKHGQCNDYRVRFSCPPPYCSKKVCWTKWFDRDNPSGTGDWETLSSLRRENQGKICESPWFIEVVTKDYPHTPAIQTGENFYMFSPTQGFVCRQKDQSSKTCLDYKVRFGCPCTE